jgi:hypothetical protein
MFVIALFTTVKLWNQPRYLTTNEWVEKCTTCTQLNIIHPERMKLCCYRKKDGTGDLHVE